MSIAELEELTLGPNEQIDAIIMPNRITQRVPSTSRLALLDKKIDLGNLAVGQPAIIFLSASIPFTSVSIGGMEGVIEFDHALAGCGNLLFGAAAI